MQGGLACDKGGSLRKWRSACQHKQPIPSFFPQVEKACGFLDVRVEKARHRCVAPVEKCLPMQTTIAQVEKACGSYDVRVEKACHRCVVQVEKCLPTKPFSRVCVRAGDTEGALQVEKACGFSLIGWRRLVIDDSMCKWRRLAPRRTLVRVALLSVVIVTCFLFRGMDLEERGDSVADSQAHNTNFWLPPVQNQNGDRNVQAANAEAGDRSVTEGHVAMERVHLHLSRLHVLKPSMSSPITLVSVVPERIATFMDQEQGSAEGVAGDSDMREENLRSVGDGTHLLDLHSLNMPWDRGKLSTYKARRASKSRRREWAYVYQVYW